MPDTIIDDEKFILAVIAGVPWGLVQDKKSISLRPTTVPCAIVDTGHGEITVYHRRPDNA